MGNMKKMMPVILMMLIVVVISFVYAWQGVQMHNQVAVEEVKFHDLQGDYFSNSKVIRDSALSDSALTAQLVEIKNYPSTLLQLKLVGVGKILTGIFILLFVIAFLLFMMPVRLSQLMKESRSNT